VPESDKRLSQDDPIVIDLLQRVSRLEARVDSVERSVAEMRERVESIDSKTWYILSGVILTILIELMRWLMH
jgi:chromosome segregation ATPase